MEKLFLGRILKRCPGVVRRAYTLFFVLIGWVIFYFEDFGQMTGYLGMMFSLGGGLLGPQARGAVLSYLPLMGAGVLACLPVWKNWYAKISGKGGVWILEAAVCMGVLLLCCLLYTSDAADE